MAKLNAKNANLFTDAKRIHKALSRLIDKYPGQYAVIVEGELFVGTEPREVAKQARSKHPKALLTCLTIPRPEDFACAL